ncbi:MAG: hypothetical protein ACJ8AT_03610 [Hyalangium sp.]|uniref:hypothetical protein n=1 Tax=Hyalangium sp. TaxID=2028555 RepID=UPI00389B10B7
MMYENGKTQSATGSMQLAATAKTKFEEFLRQKSGLADVGNPEQWVQVLSKLYPDMAARLTDESRGLSIRPSAEPEPVALGPVGSTESPGFQRYQQARQALEADLNCVVELASNRDYKAPLVGWRDAILAELGEGVGAASLAADATQRDRTFYSVRKLGDYARVARMVGLLNPAVDAEFRRLAATLDESSIVLRVLAGEALFRAGFDEGGTVFQVTLEDLRQRREAVITSLARLISGSPEDADDWGDGSASYGALYTALGNLGHSDLRAIIRPDAMSRLLTVLLDTVPQQQQELVREITSTVPLELVHLRRLYAVAVLVLEGQGGASQSASAPLSAFVQALKLFIEAFAKPGTGSRLLNIALPSPLASVELARVDDQGSDVVQELFRQRSKLAAQLDALHAIPDFDPITWPLAVKLDRVLYDVDRAIDLYLMGGGTTLDGVEERRAAIYGSIFETWLLSDVDPPGSDWNEPPPPSISKENVRDTLRKLVEDIAGELNRAPNLPPIDERNQFLKEQRILEAEWKELALQLTLASAGREQLLEDATRLYAGPDRALDADDTLEVGLIPAERVSQNELVEFTRRLRQTPPMEDFAAGSPGRAGGAAAVQSRLSELESDLRDEREARRRVQLDLQQLQARIDRSQPGASIAPPPGASPVSPSVGAGDALDRTLRQISDLEDSVDKHLGL